MILFKVFFIWLVVAFFYILFFQKEKSIRYKQLIRSESGHKVYRIDYLRWR